MVESIIIDLAGAVWSENGTVAETEKTRYVLVDIGIRGPVGRIEGVFEVAENLDRDGKRIVAIGKVAE